MLHPALEHAQRVLLVHGKVPRAAHHEFAHLVPTATRKPNHCLGMYVRSLNDSEQRVPVAVGNGTLLLILRRVEALNN